MNMKVTKKSKTKKSPKKSKGITVSQLLADLKEPGIAVIKLKS